MISSILCSQWHLINSLLFAYLHRAQIYYKHYVDLNEWSQQQQQPQPQPQPTTNKISNEKLRRFDCLIKFIHYK